MIEGYDGLAIDIWLTPLFQAFIEVSAASKAEHGATDLRTPFAEAFTGAGFLEDKAAFDAALQQEPPLDTSILGKQLVEEVQEQPPQQGGGAAGATRTLRVFHAPIASADPALKVRGRLRCLRDALQLRRRGGGGGGARAAAHARVRSLQ